MPNTLSADALAFVPVAKLETGRPGHRTYSEASASTTASEVVASPAYTEAYSAGDDAFDEAEQLNTEFGANGESADGCHWDPNISSELELPYAQLPLYMDGAATELGAAFDPDVSEFELGQHFVDGCVVDAAAQWEDLVTPEFLAQEQASIEAAASLPAPPFASTCQLAQQLAPRPEGMEQFLPLRICVGAELDGLGSLEPVGEASAADSDQPRDQAEPVDLIAEGVKLGKGEITVEQLHAIFEQQKRTSGASLSN
mmetsp:Transcript_89502/g.252125  ORF Transcript_89502/g.252125 Transcript_89502/m.252125 type:complete len:256 (+) Transcript_89502:28-795(+)